MNNINVVQDWFFTDLDDESTREKKTPVIYEYTDDPLALVCAMIRSGKDLSSIYDALDGIGLKHYKFENVIESDDRLLAEDIRKFFKNSIMLRRLKSQHISSFMEAVEDLTSSPQSVDKEHIKVLVKLPNFYRESKETEKIFSQRKSVISKNNDVVRFDGTLTFAGKIKRSSKRENQMRYYFATEDNHLFAVFIQYSDTSRSAWDYISKKDKFRIKADLVVGRQPGHDFNFYKLGHIYELSDANN